MLRHALIVDDSLPLHKIIKSHLDESGLEFHSAYDGETALVTAARLRPNLILLDVDMPGLDGFEVCRRLRGDVETGGIPIIFLTADCSIHDKAKALDLGAVDYLTKPFKPRDLSARVRAVLSAMERSEQKSMIDGLTGLWNQNYLADYLADQKTLADRSGRPCSCIMADVDGLARVNKKLGSAYGDEILRRLGSLFLSHCGTEHTVCHCDGGKFAIVMSGVNRSGAGRLAHRLCAEVRDRFLARGANEIGVTCSFGVVDTLVTGDDSVLERAELALTRAKQMGGDCVSIARTLRRESSSAA